MERRVTATAGVFVSRPPEQVFAYVADVSRHHEWSPKRFRVGGLPLDGVLEVGSTFTSYGQLPGRPDHRNEVRVVALDPPHRLVLESTDGSGTYVNTFSVTGDVDGSVVERELSLPRPGGLLTLTLPVFVRLVLGRDLSDGLRRMAVRVNAAPRR